MGGVGGEGVGGWEYSLAANFFTPLTQNFRDLAIGKLSFQDFFCKKMSQSMSANSLNVFISGLDEELEIGTATQFSKFFTLKKRLRPKSKDYFLFLGRSILLYSLPSLTWANILSNQPPA